MRLTLDREDMLPEFRKTNCGLTKFEHFKPECRQAIIAVGRATFYEFDQSSYNAIFPPKENP